MVALVSDNGSPEERFRGQIAYWKKELAGAPARLELPTDRPYPAVWSFSGSTRTFELSADTLDHLKVIAEREEATLFVILAAGFVALMHRYTGQDDILIGTTVPETAGSGGGMYDEGQSNTVVLRTRFTDSLDFLSILRQVKRQSETAFENSDIPLDQLITELQIERDLSHPPLVQALFALRGEEAPQKGWLFESPSDYPSPSKCGLSLALSESDGGLQCTIEYSRDLFDEDTITRLWAHYSTVLKGIAANPLQKISALPMLSEIEREQILHQWNNTAAEYPNACTHELFERQVNHNPDATALLFENRQLTYRELNDRANQVAHYLQKRGVGPDVLVAVCLDRSPEMVIALLGIWKAGGAYLPLDPTYPEDRLAFMLEDSAAKVLLTDEKRRHLFPASHDRAVCVDTDWPVIAQESTDNLDAKTATSSLAYIIYTSGSTGQPKGVMVHHRGLVNYLWWAIKAYSVEPGKSVPVHSSISFDLTVTALYPPLLVGGQVEMLAEDVGGQNLLTALRRTANRSLVKITPAHLELLTQEIRPDEASGKTSVFVIGGENLLAENLRLWREHAPGTRLINEYGPTETVVGCCVHEVQPTDPRSGPVSIGRPIANTQLYVLDRHRNLLPSGLTGELFIGGDGVARGYLNRPELTQERFIADPFSGVNGARLYKTGDLARYRKDGSLEYLGRADDQVKVRGYRIELGEIEASLAEYQGVKSCVVLVREDVPGNKQLVAYIVPRGSMQTNLEELQQFLRRKLPEYMMPTHFVVLDAFPLTTNGKIDRKALLTTSVDRALAKNEFVAPRTETERTLAAIWSDLLNSEKIGLTDNFFDLGGHSLMAMRLASRIREEFEVDLPLATLLEAPTIADLAPLLHKEDWTPSWSSLVPIRTGGSRPPLFLVHAHGGNVLEYYPLVSRLDPELPIYGIQAKGLDGHILKGASIEQMASAYVAEIRSLRPKGPYYLGGFCLGGLIALEAAQQLAADGQEVGPVVIIQSIHPEAARFKPSTTIFQRGWYKAIKRISLEMENLANQGKSHIAERFQRTWEVVCGRAVLALREWKGQDTSDVSSLPLPYILEAVSIEQKRAMAAYMPRPYQGDVLLFRARKQLSGLMIDASLGWERAIRGKLDVCEVPGHQQTLLREPNVTQLAAELDRRLKAAHQPKRRPQSNEYTNGKTLVDRAETLTVNR